MIPIDLSTGLPCGIEPKSDTLGLVLVGYLVTHSDGFEARLGPDKTRAELYAIRSNATIEPLFVRRKSPPNAGVKPV